jgi:hypothetical protein
MDWLLTIFAMFWPVLFFFPSCVCCPECGTNNCQSPWTEATLTMTGWTGPGNCTNLNATFIFDTPSGVNVSPQFYCFKSETSPLGLLTSVQAGVYYQLGVGHYIFGAVNSTLVSWSYVFQLLFDSATIAINCSAIGGPHSVPFSSESGTPACTHDGSDAELTIV